VTGNSGKLKLDRVLTQPLEAVHTGIGETGISGVASGAVENASFMLAVPPGSCPDIPLPEVRLLLVRAESLASAGRIATARSLFSLAIERDRSQTARHAFGCFLARTDCDEDAIAVLRTVLEDARRSGNDRLRATAANNLAALHRQRGEGTIAARYQQQAVSAETHCTTAGGELSSSTLSGCAGDALFAGEYMLAEDLFQRSLAKNVAERSIIGQADNQGSVGVIAAMTGDADRAERCLRDAYRLHREADDLRGAGSDLMNLAALFETTAQWRKVILCLTLAAELFKQAGVRTMGAQAKNRLEQLIRILAVRSRDPLRN